MYAGIGLLCAAGALAGYLCVPDAQAHAANHVSTRVLGHELQADARPSATALAFAREFLRAPIKLTVGPWEFSTTREKLGVRVDLPALAALIRTASDEHSALRRVHAQERGDGPLDLPIPAQLEGKAAETWLLRLKDQVFQRARDARMDLKSGKIIEEQRGLSLDVQATLDLLASAVFSGASEIKAAVVHASVKRTKRELENLDFGQVLGTFESRYNTLDSDRSYNLRVAARHVDGVVLFPGETFDFNAIVGERSEANGFRPAPVIAGGELTDGVGGGTCQIAGTLHAAVFFAGLPFVERNHHTRPSSYLKLGLDATVAYPKLNFRFKNDLPQAVAIGVSVGAGRVRTEIRGAQGTQREVSFVRRIDEVKPYTETTREDPSLPRGVKVLAQRGVAGFKVTSFRLVREPETQIIGRERREDTYPPTTQIWRVGSGPSAPTGYVAPAGDQHSEYQTDEYLVLTMGPGIEGLEETVKREGKTGFHGWTAREGMPQAP
ncbi:MAG: VanW family protein [Myxococcales bacterium]